MNFAQEIKMPYSTLFTVLSRGFKKSNITNVITICKKLIISTDDLAEDRIVFRSQTAPAKTKTAEQAVQEIQVKLTGDSYLLDDIPMTDTEKEVIIDHIRFAIDLIRKYRSER